MFNIKNKHKYLFLMMNFLFILTLTKLYKCVDAQPIHVGHQHSFSMAHKAVLVYNSNLYNSSIVLQPVELHVLSTGSVTVVTSGTGIYAFGRVDPLVQHEMQQTFVLRNDSNIPLIGLRLQSSRQGDMHVLAAVENSRAAPRPIPPNAVLPTVPPHQKLTLIVSLSLLGLPLGRVHETLAVLIPDKAQTVALMEINGELVPPVRFSSASLDFGRFAAGESRVAMLNLDLNPRLAPLGSVPKLFCSNPDVRIDPLPLREQDKRKSPLLSKEQRAAGLYAYRIVLPDTAPLGAVEGAIRVAYIDPPTPASLAPLRSNVPNIPPVPLPPAVVADALRNVSVQLSGEIVGDVSAAPASVAFGLVTQGKPASQSLQLSGRKIKALEGVQINSPSLWLSARLTNANSPSPAGRLPGIIQRGSRTQTLEILLSPQAPVGRLQTSLTLTLSNGQRLVLPVSALVQARVGKPVTR